MRRTTTLIILSAALLMVGFLSMPTYAASPGKQRVQGNSVTLPPGGKVTVDGSMATIFIRSNVFGRYQCECSDQGTGGCQPVHIGNQITCEKKPYSTCKGACQMITVITGGRTSRSLNSIPSTSVTPANPGGTTGLSTGGSATRVAPATRAR